MRVDAFFAALDRLPVRDLDDHPGGLVVVAPATPAWTSWS